MNEKTGGTISDKFRKNGTKARSKSVIYDGKVYSFKSHYVQFGDEVSNGI